MIEASGIRAVVEALRSAFVDGTGRPVPVRVRALDRVEAVRLAAEGTDGVRVVVLDDAELAGLPGPDRPTAAAVLDAPEAVLMAATPACC